MTWRPGITEVESADDATVIAARSQAAFERIPRRVLVYGFLLLISIGAALVAVLMVDRAVRVRDGGRHVGLLTAGMQREVVREIEWLERAFGALAAEVRSVPQTVPDDKPHLLTDEFAGWMQLNPDLHDVGFSRDLPAGFDPAIDAGAHLRIGIPISVEGVGWVLPLAYPLATLRPGESRGWITASLKVDALQRIAANLDLGAEGIAAIVHREGRLLVRSRDHARWVGTPMDGSRLMPSLVAGSQMGVFEERSPLDGIDRIVAFRTIPHSPLVVFAGVPRREVLGSWRTFAVTAAVLALLLAVAWLLLLAMLLRSRTRQRKLIKSLRASTHQLRETNRIAGLGEWTWELDTGWVTWSEELYRIYGLPPRATRFRIEEIGPLLHPEDQPRLEKELARMLEDGDPIDMEFRIVRPDASQRTVFARARWSESTTGARVLRGSQQDITELAQTRERLRRAQHEYRFLFEQNPLPMWVFDRTTLDFLAVNDAAIAHYGYVRDEWLQLGALDLHPPEDARRFEAALRNVEEWGQGGLWTHLRKDGSPLRAAIFGRGIEFDGRAARLVLAEDVTERERSEQRFQLIARATSDAVWDWDLTTQVTWRSESIFALSGYTPGEFGANFDAWGELLHPEERERVIASVEHALESGANEWQGQYRLRRKDGDYADVLDRCFILRDPEGRALRAVGGMLDVTQRHRDEADLRLLRRAVEVADNGIAIADARQPGLPLVYVNPAFEKMTGYAPGDVLGKNCRLLQGDDRDQPEIAAIRQAITDRREVRVLLRNYRRDGELFWNDFYLAPVRDDSGVLTHFVGIQSDVTERQRILDQLAYRATYDELTGLPNRQLLSDRLQQAVRNAKRHDREVGVLFIDLDDFKLINDSLGHSAGDEALRTVAERLREALRDTDTLGRFGGDEFVAILTEQTDDQGVACVIERLVASLALPISILGATHYIAASIGYTRYPEGGEDAETLLRHADVAMYQAKRQGRNRAVAYRPDFDAGMSDRLHLVSALRDALVREEFCLNFQPVFDRDRRIVGLEALVRWRHPDRGLLAPGHFIGVCEDSGLIVPLGQWVLRDALRHHARLAGQGLGHLRMAVNVSAAQFLHDGLLADVAALVREFSLPGGVLELELTESLIMSNPEGAIETIDRLAAIGVGLSVDDFGTGYSSLAYLKRLPIQRLKIDRSFVKDLGVDDDDAAICSSIIGLAHSLGLTTVAEGVETEAQFEWLRERSCDEMQGFLLGRPDDFDALLPRLLAEAVAAPRL